MLDGKVTAGVAPRLDSDLLFGSSAKKFPVLTPRYQRGGYGSGTYWPTGWGPRPDSLPNASVGYRITTDPIHYRRRNWRKNRQNGAREYLEEMRQSTWSELLRPGVIRDGHAVVFEVATNATESDRQAASDHFLTTLAPVAAAVAAIARRHRSVAVACDFGLTADWLCTLLIAHAKAEHYSLRVVNAEGTATGPDSPHATVTVSIGFESLPADVRVKALVALFKHVSHRFPGASKRAAVIPSPTEHVKVRLVDLRTSSKSARRGPHQLSLTDALGSGVVEAPSV